PGPRVSPDAGGDGSGGRSRRALRPRDGIRSSVARIGLAVEVCPCGARKGKSLRRFLETKHRVHCRGSRGFALDAGPGMIEETAMMAKAHSRAICICGIITG